ncbi:GTP-binding protein [Pantoea sp. At-9b]|uniref:CobW family GTP-binding protein n=1 Tax=Pantoea sp. (strain At-9b) TaxID=592316 RepID=UPI0001B3E57C|nr:GTP-binding protein [Pantoea sp. At-9b]ADU69957.1 cobalamin synthesis protein P47K [Pantoea sp. At-9b]
MTHVNLITGFLGSGKTTALLHLLANKPASENWAVLVNEFGEIGIDGALLADRGATLKEIPGGCMCCVNGLPLQVGLNMLLKQTKPDRLLIEPTGLGHPRQLLDMLRAAVYQPWIEVDATLTLLDPQHLADERIVQNENFRDQLIAADIVIASKSDRWNEQDRQRLTTWREANLGDRQWVEMALGQIDPALLRQQALADRAVPAAQHHHTESRPQGLAALKLDGQARWRRALNEGQGYASCGWIFDADTVFDTLPALEWARLAPVDRVKGVLRTPDGLVTVNRQGEDLFIETRPTTPPDSRIELIHHQPVDWNILQSGLLKIRLK